MVGKRSPSSFSSSFKQKLAKECVNPSIRKKDAVSIEGFLEKHLSRMSYDDRETLNRVLRVKESGMMADQEKRKELINMLNDVNSASSIRKLLLIGAFYRYGVSLPMNAEELDAITKLAMVYEKSLEKSLSLPFINATLENIKQEKIITGEKKLDQDIKITGFNDYLERMRRWKFSRKLEPRNIVFKPVIEYKKYSYDESRLKELISLLERQLKFPDLAFEFQKFLNNIKDEEKSLKKRIPKIKTIEEFENINKMLQNFYTTYSSDLERILLNAEGKYELDEKRLSYARKDTTNMLNSLTLTLQQDLKKKKETMDTEYEKSFLFPPPEEFMKDITKFHDMKRIEEKWNFEEGNREEIDEIIRKSDDLERRKEKYIVELSREKKKVVKEEGYVFSEGWKKGIEMIGKGIGKGIEKMSSSTTPVIGGDFRVLKKLMDKTKEEDTKILEVRNLDTSSPYISLTTWGDDIFDYFTRIIRNILNDPSEIDLFLKDSIEFLPFIA